MTKNLVGLCLGVLCFVLSACGSSPDPKNGPAPAGKADATAATPTGGANTSGVSTFVPGGKIPPPSVILGRQQVPILCYHQIRDWKPTDSKMAKDYIMPIADFRAQLKMLHDSGYHTILPDQLYAYLTKGAALPSKPVMLTFDDNDEDQYTIAFPEMKKYGYKGVFFIMTITLGKLPHYMSKEQVKELYDAGNVIGSHTWDHHNVKKYQGKDWEIQIDKPTKQLEAITGTPIRYFAYPFGLWNAQAFPELRKRGFIAAFGLADKRDQNDPLMCIRRIIVGGGWGLKTFSNAMHQSFK
ncbi:polysaccharide deacetylase family protein [Flavitalea sp. BT771]|uniref:polysaccharide deacetylase family protein n=1 Tax=Flavitalea sp. BT771 TaxID=3063329 RepID=UPI0026E29E76|nr:polysaccharide deacetylase family protein [Flavitalea sp. BT771]MDO6430190.1 polysaccharide deacetylase family protein [Flavitalea sp. BT771]MDV6219671.1 polysaccharide deacetylase family protein [Flavitalea sp. BT771]